MKIAIVPASQLGDDWTAEHHVGQAEEVSSSASPSEESMPVVPRPPATDTLTPRVTGACWTEGCEEPIAVPPMRVTYWCERHDTERRERIKAAMANLENDSYGIPRKNPDAHDVSISESGYYGWQWKCSCGKSSASWAKTEGLARAASYRHLRAVEKAAA